MWLKKLQISIIEKDPEKIDTLVQNMPHFESVDEMKSASSLVKEALKLLNNLKDETAITMRRLQQHKDFLNATLHSQTNRLDIKS